MEANLRLAGARRLSTNGKYDGFNGPTLTGVTSAPRRDDMGWKGCQPCYYIPMRSETSAPPAGASPTAAEIGFRLGVLLLTGALGAWLANHMTLLQWDNDEGMFALFGWAIASGIRPYTEFWIDQPPGGGLLLAAVYRFAGPSLTAARGATLAMGLSGAIGVALIARRLGGRLAGWAAIPLLVLSPHFFWLSRSLNLDLPALAPAVLGLAAAWRYRDTGRGRWLVGAGLLVGLGASFKLHALIVAFPIGLLLLQRARAVATAGESGGEPAGDAPAGGSPTGSFPARHPWLALLLPALRDGMIFAAGVLACAAAWLLVAPPAALLDEVFGSLARARAAFPPRTGEYAVWLVRDNLLGENLGLTALALFGLAWLTRRGRADAAVMGLWCAVTGLVLITQRPMWPKHHWSLVLWPLAILAGVGVAGLVDLTRLAVAGSTSGWRAIRAADPPPQPVIGWGLAGGLALVVWLAALPGTVRKLGELANPRQFAAVADGIAWIEESLPADAVVISDNGLLPFVTGRRTPPATAVVSSKRIRTGDLTGGALIQAAESSQAAAVMIWNNQLSDFGEFRDYLPTRYVLERVVGDDREIWRRFDFARITHPQAATVYDIGQLEGYDLPRAGARPDQSLPLTLFWRAAGPTGADYTVFAHLVDADGRTVVQADGPPAGGAQPSSGWVAGEIVVDPRAIALPADLAPGDYRLRVGFYDPATLQRAGAAGPDGRPWPEGAIVLDARVRVAPR